MEMIENRWIKVDIWPKGRAGFDAEYRVDGDVVYVYVEGTNHWIDWVHHFLPGAKKRERQGAEMLMKRLTPLAEGRKVKIGGYSLGGAVAVQLSNIITWGEVLLVGSKRPGRQVEERRVESWMRRGDVVGWLPPWRRKAPNIIYFGEWTWKFWRAHQEPRYRDLLEMEGLR